MKKLFTLIAVVALFATSAMAQVTVTMSFTNPSYTSLSDYTAGDSYGDNWYQWVGQLSDDGTGAAYVCVNATSMTATVEESMMDWDYTMIYYLDGDGNTCVAQGLSLTSGSVTVVDASKNSYTADYTFTNTDTIFNIHFAVADPTADSTVNIAADLLIYNDYWDYFEDYGFYMFIAQAMQTDAYAFQAYVLKDAEATEGYDYTGTFTEEDVYAYGIYYWNADSQAYYSVANPFSMNVTFTKDANDATNATGSVLCYDNVLYSLNLTGAAGTAVENAEVSEYQAYTEGNTIVLNGAEGQNAAIYDIAGRQISNGMVTSNAARFEVAASGVYMVRVNGQTLRVVVK